MQSQKRLPEPTEENPEEELDRLIDRATRAGFRVDGVPLSKALLRPEVLSRMEQIVFNDDSLPFFRKKASRMEFIAEGPLPFGLDAESPLKTEPVFKQVIGYGICKGCRLCIEVCPKHVYTDDGFGRPDRKNRREEECTGGQCSQCVDICPEHTIQVVLADPVFKSTLFLLLPNPATLSGKGEKDFFVPNPLETGRPLKIANPLPADDLKRCHRLLNEADFFPLLEVRGYPRHFVDSRDPEGDLRLWAEENGRDFPLALKALRFLYRHLAELPSLRQGKYRLDPLLHRVIDEMTSEGAEINRRTLGASVHAAFLEEPFLGAKRRPIGGLLPPGTSIAWKTPYGEEIPEYAHLEKCLGPECGLCVTQCPEGGGGRNSAIRMVLKVPRGTVPSLVRGFNVFLLRLDGSQARAAEVEDLTGQSPFAFEIDAEYCKSCGICIACCPHDVIEPASRRFDLKGFSK